jgi:DNA-binding transcriptional regulator YhcF (GntR family)
VTRQPDTGGLGGLGALDFAIDRRAEVPIGVQVAWALRARIHDGRLVPGQRLPGLRDLAQALKVNANTVRAVYQRLEHEGMIESQQGSGTYVADTAHRPSAAGAIAANAAREAHQTGVDPREVAAALYVEPGPPAQPDEAAAHRRELRAQIAALERVLVKIETEHPGLVAPSRKALPALGPRLLDVEELEQVQTHLVRRLAALQNARDDLERGREAAAEPERGRQAPAAKPASAEPARAAATAPKRAARPRRPPRPAPA